MKVSNLLAAKWLGEAMEGIEGAIGNLLWGLFQIFFYLLDWLQSLFRSLAGLESMNINGQAVNASVDEPAYDIVYYLIGSDIVIDIFVSMIVFGMILLVVMTILAIIRNTYQDKQKPISSFIYDSFKGLLGFLLVPIACIVGLMFSNVILQLVDSATSYGNSTSMSMNLYIACAYDANVLRNGTEEEKLSALNRLIEVTNFEEYDNGVAKTYITNEVNGDYNALTEEHYDRLADYLDEAFTGGALTYDDNGKTLTIYNQGRNNVFVKGVAYKKLSINYFILIVCGSLILGIF
ncbi:MAG: hypothetical protein IJX26_04105, partial [Clostridia bacterium]|nr:hypothetical protein [Clostridia bacterium]